MQLLDRSRAAKFAYPHFANPRWLTTHWPKQIVLRPVAALLIGRRCGGLPRRLDYKRLLRSLLPSAEQFGSFGIQVHLTSAILRFQVYELRPLDANQRFSKINLLSCKQI